MIVSRPKWRPRRNHGTNKEREGHFRTRRDTAVPCKTTWDTEQAFILLLRNHNPPPGTPTYTHNSQTSNLTFIYLSSSFGKRCHTTVGECLAYCATGNTGVMSTTILSRLELSYAHNRIRTPPNGKAAAGNGEDQRGSTRSCAINISAAASIS
ncbi:hypothetical protein O3P69_016432 [Scylla paramamosain]|uniref:Uncharacterized protein n=1 Tax=Scylla paramamosain TaxID=85552 RepID=A0AAW0TGR2_SCYPA